MQTSPINFNSARTLVLASFAVGATLHISIFAVAMALIWQTSAHANGLLAVSAQASAQVPAQIVVQPSAPNDTAPAASALPISRALANEIVDNFRRMIVLHEAFPAKLNRASSIAGHQLFFKNRLLTTQLIHLAASEPTECDALAEAWEADPDWREVDRIALSGVLSELALKLSVGSISAGSGSASASVTSPILENAPCLSRIRAARDAAANLRNHYSQEITAVLDNRADTKPMPRGDWALYLRFIQSRYTVKNILAGFAAAPIADRSAPTPPPIQANRKPTYPPIVRDEWNDGGLPSKAVLLTFDDGPHPIHTPLILDVLDRYNIKAVFFMIGDNIGTIHADNHVTLREPALIARILKSGHYIANHTLTHPLLPKLNEAQLSDEIDRTERLLSAATPDDVGRARLFRPPYGARNDLVLTEVAARGLRSVIWNIDSRDWADPIPKSVAKRVLVEVAREGGGIILFHDIHAPAVEALPIVIDELLKRGFQFARFEDDKLMVDLPVVAPMLKPVSKSALMPGVKATF